MQDARSRLIVGLDVPTTGQAAALVATLGDAVSFYKIGLELIPVGGLGFARELIAGGKRVFLDMKVLDIGRTVAASVAGFAAMGVSMLSVHAYPKAMTAATEAAHGSGLCLLGVTALTSMDAADLREAGYRSGPGALVARRARQAVSAGMGGIVCSAREARAARRIAGPDFAVVTPGIRPACTDRGDQKRVATPGEALRAGASHLVIARPIVTARDPQRAAVSILTQMDAALTNGPQ